MKVSIIIPTYKPSNYLEECLFSINNQNYNRSNIQLIVVLNGDVSYTEYIQQVLSEMSAEFDICFLVTEEKGVSNARNLGLENVKGEYVCFIDDDDLISPNYINNLSQAVTENTIAVSNVKTFTDSVENLKDDYISKSFQDILNSKYRQKSLFYKRAFLSSSCCKIIPMNIINSKKFNTTYEVGEDSLFMFSISDGINEISLVEENTIYYRRCRGNSVSNSSRSFMRKLLNACRLTLDYTRLYIHSPFKYNFSIYISRIIASYLQLFR